MNNKGRVKNLILIMILLSIISGIATFIIIDGKNKTKDQTDSVSKITDTANEDSSKSVVGELSVDTSIDEVFDDIESIYLKNTNNPTNVVEVRGNDKSFIVANLKGLTMERWDNEKFRKEVYNLDEYRYEIPIMEKNKNLKLYEDYGYILLENRNNGEIIYKIPKRELTSFVNILERIYLDKQVERILFPIPDNMYIAARDENSVYVLNEEEMEEIISNLDVLSIEEQHGYIGVTSVYPDYAITFKRGEDEYSFELINDNIMIMNTPIVYLYCKYDSALWSYAKRKLPVKNNAKPYEIKYLLNCEKVIVNDVAGIYNLEDDNYYNIVIARTLNKVHLLKKDDCEIEEELKFNLKFIINGELNEVEVYDNYITYGQNCYYSKNIGEAVKSVLMVP